ncbi:MAG TPA: glycosyltransferase [Tenuifilaceae bacterium]|nr:glycosyltransferase [Tenuifilaceae bacterium]HPJ45934.1 glycosyltransferase [Tenuifilaceae bacterium]HRX67325.1 glycosyltransferase [Tenuifilaceae bacterium]
MKKVILLATTDLVADQRVHRSALTLHENGFTVLALGRRLKYTPTEVSVPYSVHRFKLLFNKGFLFYKFFNVRAFFYLVFHSFDILLANDLDALLAARVACFLKGKPLVYDSHELFTEVPELINRKFTRSVWLKLEKSLVPGLKFCTTVSEGVASELKKRYSVNFTVIRNVPFYKEISKTDFTSDGKTIIYQGALNIGRGLEKLIAAMQLLPHCKLLIAGTGDIEQKLKNLCHNLGLQDRVSFLGRIPHEELHLITCKATIGVSLEEDLGLSYHFALPNKLFDYIQAGLPVLVSNLPEMKSLVSKYSVGLIVDSNLNASALANQLEKMLENEKQLEQWHANAVVAAKELCWEKERHKLLDIFKEM